MEKWASKWLEMQSQRHRFLKKILGEIPQTPLQRNTLSYSPPLASRAARFKCPTFSAPPVINPSRSSPANFQYWGDWPPGWGGIKKLCKNGAKIGCLTRSCICVLRTDFRMALYPGISFKTSSSIARESSPFSQSVSNLLM